MRRDATRELYIGGKLGGVEGITDSQDQLLLSLVPGVGIVPYTGPATVEAGAAADTLTAPQLLSGLYIRDCNGGARADVLPTGPVVVAAIPNCAIGMRFPFTVINNSGAAFATTLTAPDASVTLFAGGTFAVTQGNRGLFLCEITAIGAAGTYTVYSLGIAAV